jgi:hypothetical protein
MRGGDGASPCEQRGPLLFWQGVARPLRALSSALESTGAARPCTRNFALCSHGCEHNRSGVIAKGIGGPNVESTIWLGILIGSTLGGLIPSLLGDGMFTYSSVLLSGVGAFVGLWVGFKISV